MNSNSSTIVETRPVLSVRTGLWWGFVGVVAFSFTVPFTRLAVEGLSPLFVGSARAVIAALLASIALVATRQHLPNMVQWRRLAIVAGGTVLGFPLLTSYALTTAPASHGAIVIALLPAATAIMVVLRTKERPAPSFWIFAILGAVAAVFFAGLQGSGFGNLTWSDLLLFGAVLAAAVGYAEGGLLARELGAWQTVSWALVLAAPLMMALAIVAVIDQPQTGTPLQWMAFIYLGVVSLFLGFFAWYRGLAIGPMTQVSQVQLAQPVMSILWAGLILHEVLTWQTLAGGVAVILCAGLAVRARLFKKGAR
ncbi:DMT family transporter [Paeniglutamicibacter terrestris]|uniref:DMT family transporter n=1 Tax=Paeniglutamicibacter terrestris TaxID=2723403 RepID=A0ABX1G3G8_9MICC|nr:DMT family transporter [Paeniglutamicibacter terrestris]ASN40987.1 EamA family transporter [Arthrobacter sp. 7749]NKG20785.1 DMT family transporter [Paeniglutamicibacter terrestris]